MDLALTKKEKQILKQFTKKEIKSGIVTLKFPFSLLIASGILILFPIVFIIINISNLDNIMNTVGIYLGILIFAGICCGFYYQILLKQNKEMKEKDTLKSAILKIINTYQISL
jgi:positive regulator of sigma E activity